MDAGSIIVTGIGCAGTIFGIASAINGLSARKQASADRQQAHDDKIRAESAEEAKVSTQLSLIQQSMSNLEKGQAGTAGKVETIEKTVSEHTAAIAVLTDSNKQAHHRIGDLWNEIHANKEENP